MSSESASLNRAAIVTGAAQGIGRAIALRLAQDGYDVAVNDLASGSEALNVVAEEIRAKGRMAITVFGDVSSEQDVQTIVDRTVEELGVLYVMVANAGIAAPSAPVIETSLEMWNRFLSINLTGTFLCYKAAARQMLKQGHGGRIIGASSGLGKRGGPEVSAYSASKFGVRGLTQSMASELAKERIAVNAYAPGYIDTPLTQKADRDFSTSTGKPPGTLSEAYKAQIPMGRSGTSENVSALVSYIVSDEADYRTGVIQKFLGIQISIGIMTGQAVSLNGGLFYD